MTLLSSCQSQSTSRRVAMPWSATRTNNRRMLKLLACRLRSRTALVRAKAKQGRVRTTPMRARATKARKSRRQLLPWRTRCTQLVMGRRRTQMRPRPRLKRGLGPQSSGLRRAPKRFCLWEHHAHQQQMQQTVLVRTACAGTHHPLASSPLTQRAQTRVRTREAPGWAQARAQAQAQTRVSRAPQAVLRIWAQAELTQSCQQRAATMPLCARQAPTCVPTSRRTSPPRTS